MSLADDLTSASRKQGGLTVLDLSDEVFDTDAPVPDPDYTGSVWPMRDARGWWMVHGFAGKHRKSHRVCWLVECLTCGREQTIRTSRLLDQAAYCHHGKRN